MWDINITGNGVGPLGVAELSFQIFCKLLSQNKKFA